MTDASVKPYLISSLTTEAANADDTPSDTDNKFVQARIIALWILFVIGIVGNSMVVGWLWFNRKNTSRMNKIVLGLAIADFCVCFFVMFVSAMHTMNKSHWRLGNAMCKINQHLQSMSLMASSFMLVLLALDRHQAIRRPLKPAFPLGIYKMIGLGWACAVFLSVPQFFVWHEQLKPNGFRYCTTTLSETWKIIYITYASLAQCLVPFLIITVAYARMTKKIWDKSRITRRMKRQQGANQEMYSPSKTESLALNADSHRQEIMKQARSKTLKMSIVIILAYVICGVPYFLQEIIRVYRPDLVINQVTGAVLGISAVTNSAVNPYIFIFFTMRRRRMSQK
ncbi:arg8-vasotocin receptor-like [Amphiura filiformis]|uniref:arg8-vasotocin receptor-like n=1 Tax=Amphiura filiformis TaxID=82378 RepID=UPI003B21EB2C